VRLVAAAAATVALPAASQATASGSAPRLVKPPRLKPKALVGLIAPGGVVGDELIQKCVTNLESQGFTVKLGKHLRAEHGGYAGTVQDRLHDLHAMLSDREVAAIWTARGGSGCIHLLPHLDYGLARKRPKILIGTSDITALQLGFLRHAGVASFHGPTAGSTFTDFSVSNMLGVLMEPTPKRVLPMADENLARSAEMPQFRPRVFRHGTAEGRLVGGNLSLVAALVGTPYGIQDPSHLLFLEEIGEAPYRVDRLLTQLQLARVSTRARGVVMGVFQRCEPTDGEPSLTLAETLEERMAPLPVPSAYGYSFGHIADKLTLPLGIRARLDTEARTITLLEPAVS
jgi:muramoyltetrapeptide carboxypeptidase